MRYKSTIREIYTKTSIGKKKSDFIYWRTKSFKIGNLKVNFIDLKNLRKNKKQQAGFTI
jgi:hypothetical protein